jgi:hypothetical protein
MNPSPLVRLWPLSSRLRWFTTLSIVAGVAALAWATLALPLMPAIALGSVEITGRNPAAAGLLFWIVLGLGGSLRPASLGGHAVLTFHLPFIVAAMLLGGPVAGGWVAFVSTIELRELKEVPWYGALANHAAQALGAVVGGIAAAAMRQAVATLVAPEAAALGAALAGALVFSVVVVAHTAITVALREELTIHEVALLFSAPWRRTILAEIILAWVLAFAYVGIGWWAAGVCAVLAVLVWEAQDDRDRVSRDDMTGLLNRRGLIARLDAAVSRARRTGVAGPPDRGGRVEGAAGHEPLHLRRGRPAARPARAHLRPADAFAGAGNGGARPATGRPRRAGLTRGRAVAGGSPAPVRDLRLFTRRTTIGDPPSRRKGLVRWVGKPGAGPATSSPGRAALARAALARAALARAALAPVARAALARTAYGRARRALPGHP